jgi:hypothetical protein
MITGTISDFTGEGIRAGIDPNRRLSSYSRGACPFIPAGPLSFYSRRAGAARPPPRRQPPAAFSSFPACADGDGRDPSRCREACGPATIVRLLRSAVARRPQRRARKLPVRGSPRPGPQLESTGDLMSLQEPTVDDRDSGRTVTAVTVRRHPSQYARRR